MKYRRKQVFTELFSNLVNNQDYNTALIYIKLYGTLTNIDVDIYINILNKILGLNTFFMGKKDNILGVYNVPENVMINYNLAIDRINNDDYNSALKHICVCEKLIRIKHLDIDLKMIELLLKHICIQNHKVKRKEQIKDIEDALISEDNIGCCYYLLIRLNDLIDSNNDIVLLLIEICLQLKDYEQIESLLHYFSESNSILSTRINYYCGEVQIYNLNKINYLELMYYEREIERLFSLGQVEEAEVLCKKKIAEDNNSIYLYKLGILLYSYNYYDKAKKAFIEYLASNNLHFKTVYYYLYFICIIEGNSEEAEEYLKMIYDLSIYNNSDFDINKLRLIIDRHKDNFTSSSVFNIEKDIFCNFIPQLNKQYIKR